MYIAVEFGDWFDWVLGWEKEIDNGDLNVHLVYFEDLRKVYCKYYLDFDNYVINVLAFSKR